MLKQECLNIIKKGIVEAINRGEAGSLTEADIPNFNVEVPKNRDFGDIAINISSLSRYTKKSPLETAKTVIKNIEPSVDEVTDTREVEKYSIKVVGGYINFKIKQDTLNSVMNKTIIDVLTQNTEYGRSDTGKGEKVILEYVSANPTGPFHIGHGRWAAVGSALANIMNFAGYNVYQEFYVNDAGNQINNLGRSLYIRILQEMGIDIDFPPEEANEETTEEVLTEDNTDIKEQVRKIKSKSSKSYYKGEYLKDCAKKFVQEKPDLAKKLAEENMEEPDNATLKEISLYAKTDMLARQKKLLEEFETHFDNFYLETTLHENGDVQKCLDKLTEKGKLYEKDNALLFKSSEYGDDEDRVIKKTNGDYTYLTADIAYHYDKIKRGFSKLINIWGADHHGYIPRMRASIEALGGNPSSLIVLLGQLVNLSIKGEQVRMGKRTKMITLEDLIGEVGVDATRFWMIMRDINNTLEFDVDLAKSKTDENPVFYVQYAHARACSIIRNAISERQDTVNNKTISSMFDEKELEEFFSNIEENKINILWNKENMTEEGRLLIEKLAEYKAVIANSAKTYMPYLITKYLKELASIFHKFYASTRILSEDKELTKAKLAIVKSTIIVLKSGLKLLGISAPEKM